MLTVCLLHGTAHATLGAQDDLAYVVGRLRQAWPDVRIHLRGDSGFGTPTMYEACEKLNDRLHLGHRHECPAEERERFSAGKRRGGMGKDIGQPQRLFMAFWYQAQSWPSERWVVVKCEAHAEGTNRRAVVTNRPGAFVLPGAAYDAYADRGESENRNKELKRGLQADRLSDHRYFANLFRLYLHAAAFNLLIHLRHVAADPPPASVKRKKRCPPKPFGLPAAADGTTAAVNTIPWEKVSRVPGGRDSSRSPLVYAKAFVVWSWNSPPVGPIWTPSAKPRSVSWPTASRLRIAVDAPSHANPCRPSPTDGGWGKGGGVAPRLFHGSAPPADNHHTYQKGW